MITMLKSSSSIENMMKATEKSSEKPENREKKPSVIIKVEKETTKESVVIVEPQNDEDVNYDTTNFDNKLNEQISQPTVKIIENYNNQKSSSTNQVRLKSKDSGQSQKANSEKSNGTGHSSAKFGRSNSVSNKDRGQKSKIGHRRVDRQGNVTYRRQPLELLGNQIQLGVYTCLKGSKIYTRDILLHDFETVEAIRFPEEGGNSETSPTNTGGAMSSSAHHGNSSTRDGSKTLYNTPKHNFGTFDFKLYAAHAFRYFRKLFGIQENDFLQSIGSFDKTPLISMSNPGASGSSFWKTHDDQFILKTVQKDESIFLRKLLPAYYMNCNQNPRTLLPKFLGLYCIKAGGKKIRILIMNNLVPSSVPIHQKFDLKGSSHGRQASEKEKSKSSPTLKDNDFRSMFKEKGGDNQTNKPEGIHLEPDIYNALLDTLRRDCLVLHSFKIMDYSLLLAIYNVDKDKRQSLNQSPTEENQSLEGTINHQKISSNSSKLNSSSKANLDRIEYRWQLAQGTSSHSLVPGSGTLGRNLPTNTSRNNNNPHTQMLLNSSKYTTATGQIMASTSNVQQRLIEEELNHWSGGIPAFLPNGDRVLLYIGIIDILQHYKFKKMVEHHMKSLIYDGNTVSVHKPSFYKERFIQFMELEVFATKKFNTTKSLSNLQSALSNHTNTNTTAYNANKLGSSTSKLSKLSNGNETTINADKKSTTSNATKPITSMTIPRVLPSTISEKELEDETGQNSGISTQDLQLTYVEHNSK